MILREHDTPERNKLTRADLLNNIAKHIGAQSYLEIGVQTGKTFRAIEVAQKVGVDPDPYAYDATIHTTSDLFFSCNDQKFDLIYVDGLHEWETALRDIDNAVECLTPCGVIVVDDIAPRRSEHQTRRPTAIHWTGDVWKSWFVAMQKYSDRFDMFAVDIAFGEGVMRPKIFNAGEAEVFEGPKFDPDSDQWGFYVDHHKEFLRMMSFEAYKKVKRWSIG